MRLTAKERVLLHLLESAQPADEVEVSTAVTQEGLARGTGIGLRHLIQFIRPLIRDGLVHERTAHVTGKRQRMKVYGLTSTGRTSAIRLRETVKTQVVRIRDGDAVREGSLHEALRGIGARTSLLETVRQVEETGILDLEAARRPPEPGFVEQLSDAPRVETFVGRREELATITCEDKGPRVFVIRGMAGIGKSTLAAKACELVRGRRNLFWHRIRPWESDSMLLASLGRFLDALDRPGLSSVLRRGEPRLGAEVLRQDLPDTHAFLVLDDAHEASSEALAVIRMLAEAVVSAPDVKVVVLTRRALPFYDVRDVVIKGLVREIELDRLEPEEAAALLTEEGDAAQFAGLGRRLGGHPLLIELVRNQRSDIPSAVRDVHRFLEEAIHRELSQAERAIMKAASLYRVPVPRATLLAIPGSSYQALVTLQERSLLRFVGGERYEIHDTIRDYFGNILTPEESQDFGTLAVAQLRELAARAFAAGELLSGIACLSNAIRLSQDSQQRAGIGESLGDAEARIGDLPAAMLAYRGAIRLVSSPGVVARLHRKIATALQVRGEIASASAEVDQAVRSLGNGNDVERGWLSLVRSRMSIASEQWSEGRECAEAAVSTFRSFEDIRGQTEALVELAIVETNSPMGHPDAARTCLKEALRLSHSIGDPDLIASVHVQYANLYAYRLGNTDRAMEHLGAIEALPGTLADVRSHQSLLMLKGWLNLDLRADFEGAHANFMDAFNLSTKTHDRITAALARYGAAVAVYHAGDCASARGEIEVIGLELLEFGCAGPAVEALWMAAEICLVLGDLEGYRAISSKLEAPVLARGLEIRPVLAHALEGLECLARGDRAGVRAAFLQAIRDAEQDVSPQERPLIPFAHDLYGAALHAMGEERASAEEDRLAIEFSRRFGLKGRLAARVKFLGGLRNSLRQLFASSAASTAPP